jgi:phosphatidylinositol alpha-mannosyltransferase
MKVGIVCDSSLKIPGGVQEYTRGVHDFLCARGVDVQIITAGDAGAEDRGRNVISLGRSVEFGSFPWRDAGSSSPLNWVGPEAIRRFLRRENFDILHYAGPPGTLGSLILYQTDSVSPRTRNVMAFLIYNESIPASVRLSSPIFRRFNPFLHGRIAISAPAAEYAQWFYPGPYTIIPAGVNRQRFNPDSGTIAAFLDGKVNLLFVGRLDRRKNISGMLEAYARIRPAHPEIRLIVVGDGPDRKLFEASGRRGELEGVVIVGRVGAEELPKYYNTCDVFCAPATGQESFGVVLLEAMACAKPITGYGNRGYRSVVDGSPLSAFLVEPQDNAGFARVLESLIEDVALRRQVGEEALRLVCERYAWEVVGERLLEFYRSLQRSGIS